MHNIKPLPAGQKDSQAVQYSPVQSQPVPFRRAARCACVCYVYARYAGMEEACIKRTINESCAPHVWPYSWPTLLMASVASHCVRLNIGNDLYGQWVGQGAGASPLCLGVAIEWPFLKSFSFASRFSKFSYFLCPGLPGYPSLSICHLSCVFYQLVPWIKSLVGRRQSSAALEAAIVAHFFYLCHSSSSSSCCSSCSTKV